MSPERDSGRLAVVIDGVPVADEEARAIWARFSRHMEEHRGDLGGFARAEGFTSAHPRSADGKAVLVLSRSQPQEPYGKAADPAGGSSVRQNLSPRPGTGAKTATGKPRKRPR